MRKNSIVLNVRAFFMAMTLMIASFVWAPQSEANQLRFKRTSCEYQVSILDAQLARGMFNSISAETETMGDGAFFRSIVSTDSSDEIKLQCAFAGPSRSACELSYSHQIWKDEPCLPREGADLTTVLSAEASQDVARHLARPIALQAMDDLGHTYSLSLDCHLIRNFADQEAPSCRLQFLRSFDTK